MVIAEDVVKIHFTTKKVDAQVADLEQVLKQEDLMDGPKKLELEEVKVPVE